ncbi:MAG: hypothetical protein ABWZ88_17060 [Variovorax sp.]
MQFVNTAARAAVVLACVLGAGVQQAGAQTSPARQTIDIADAAGASRVVSVVGEITAIDVANRIVAIKGPKGNIAEMRVDPAVRNLEQVKVGDRIRLSYRVAVALALVKGGDGIREKVETDAAAVAAKGARPGAAIGTRTTIVANVESVNTRAGTVTLRGPEGKFVDVKVRSAKLLHEVKAGDQVVANITETVAVRVRPAS